MKKIKIITMLALLLSGCTQKKEELTMFSNASVSAGFDTYISIKVASKTQEEFDEYFNNSINQFERLNKLFDIYHNYEGINNIKTINDNAGISKVKVDKVIIDLVKQAKEFYTISNGEFDITLGPVLKIWHKYRTEGLDLMAEGKLGKVPNQDELLKAQKCVGWENVEIDEIENTIFLTKECASLDVGGIAKGFATEFVAKNLEEKNIVVGVVDAGGNNRTINTKLDGTPWRVGIQHPNGSSQSIIAIKMDGSMSFVTSGDYQRYYIGEDNKTYHHIINPSTLYPAEYYNSVSIITNDSGIADILSTTLFTLDIESGKKLIKDFKEKYPEKTLEVVWISKNKIDTNNVKEKDNYYIAYTDNLEEKIIWE